MESLGRELIRSGRTNVDGKPRNKNVHPAKFKKRTSYRPWNMRRGLREAVREIARLGDLASFLRVVFGGAASIVTLAAHRHDGAVLHRDYYKVVKERKKLWKSRM